MAEAEEAQIKIEELRDEEYNMQRSALLAEHDAEIVRFQEQRKEHAAEFENTWNQHELQLLQSSKEDIEAFESA